MKQKQKQKQKQINKQKNESKEKTKQNVPSSTQFIEDDNLHTTKTKYNHVNTQKQKSFKKQNQKQVKDSSINERNKSNHDDKINNSNKIKTKLTKKQKQLKKNNKHSSLPHDEDKKQNKMKEKNEKQQNYNQTNHSKNKEKTFSFQDHWTIKDCLQLYQKYDPKLIRGKIRFKPGCCAWNKKTDVVAYVKCDRGSFKSDIIIRSHADANRAIDGDIVYVILNDSVEHKDDHINQLEDKINALTMDEKEKHSLTENDEDDDSFDDQNQLKIDTPMDNEIPSTKAKTNETTWRENQTQRKLWDPIHDIKKTSCDLSLALDFESDQDKLDLRQSGIVVQIVPPFGPNHSPSIDSQSLITGTKVIVGTLEQMRNATNRIMFVPNKRTLPKFVVPSGFKFPKEDSINEQKNKLGQIKEKPENDHEFFISKTMYSAEYKYGTWTKSLRFPPCCNVKRIGKVYNVEDETEALLAENGVNHGDFSPDVLSDVDRAVQSGIFIENSTTLDESIPIIKPDLSWKPTTEMYKGRRDYTSKRIFTIDPTTAKDLDDALHITPLPNNKVEIGVHIADVSFFVTPDSSVDDEARYRGTTVYLVDRTIPMLPRPLCEIACSLNENVERLAFSCVWTMNLDGTLAGTDENDREIWYGKTVIKSCARLDYKTAQNIIDKKVGIGEDHIDEELWPKMRRPTGGHTIEQLCADVRLMHRVAMARRKLRFENGALTLNGIKLAFELEGDGTSPRICEPYPIRDSNRLIEEYMLLANYLVAQRLITHAGGLALLRRHPPPQKRGIGAVVDAAQNVLGFEIDTSDSKTIQDSLSRLGRQCNDELVLQCITEMLTLPMNPALYFAAGECEEELWNHFALNIPYYTHFTSPIRRYPDVIVHRLLEATILGEQALDSFHLKQRDIQIISDHCNEKKESSKKASDRSDRVFLSIFLKKQPIAKALGVVLSIGEKSFTVFVPILGLSQKLFLDDHEHLEASTVIQNKKLKILNKDSKSFGWITMNVKLFSKIKVSCRCKLRPPIDVCLRLVGPWMEENE